MSTTKRRSTAKLSTTLVTDTTRPSLPRQTERRPRHAAGDYPAGHPYHSYTTAEKQRLDGTIRTLENNVDDWLSHEGFENCAAGCAALMDSLLDGSYPAMQRYAMKRELTNGRLAAR